MSDPFTALASLGMDLYSLHLQKEGLELSKEQAGVSNLLTLEGLRGASGQIDVGLQEAKANIGSYENYLSRWPEYAALQEDIYEEQGQSQLDQLLGALGVQNAVAAFRGMGKGPSTASTLAGKAKEDVTTFAGSDMALGGEVGLYERGLAELTANLAAEQQTAQNQLAIWNTTLETLGGAKARTDSLIDTLSGQIDPETGQFKSKRRSGPQRGLGVWNVGEPHGSPVVAGPGDWDTGAPGWLEGAFG